MKKNIVLLPLILLFQIGMISADAFPGVPPQGPGPSGTMAPPGMGLPPMTPEEMAKWQEEVTKEIDQFVTTLSPEEQAQFHKDVEELTKVMSQMSEDELVEFIGNMFPEEGAMPQPFAPAVQEVEAPTPTPAPVVEKPSQPTIPAKNIEAAEKLINDIISHAERFVRKTLIIPELDLKFQQWTEQSALKEKKAGLTWKQLKDQIEQFIDLLHDVKELDPKTKQPRHIEELIKHETLYNNLMYIHQKLALFEGKVEAPSFGLGEVSAQSREAIKELLSVFIETFYKLDVVPSINKLLEKYEPRAKTLREEEESSRKRAVEESKKARVEAPKRETKMPDTTGRKPSYDYGAGGDYGYPTYGGGGRQPYYEPYYDDYGPYQPSSGGQPQKGASAGKPAQQTGPQATKPSEPGAPGAQGKQDASKKKEEAQLDPMTVRKLDKLEKAIQEAAQAVGQGQLKTIHAHMFDKTPVDIETAINHLPVAKKKLKNLLDQLKSFKLSQAGSGGDNLAKEIRSIFNDYKGAFENIHTQIHAIVPKLASAPADKQYAYFGGKQKERASKDIQTKVPMPESLENIEALLKQISNELGVPLKVGTKLPEAPKAPVMKEPAAKESVEGLEDLEMPEPHKVKKEKADKEVKAKSAAPAPKASHTEPTCKRRSAPPAAPLEGYSLERALRTVDQQFDIVEQQLANLQGFPAHIQNVNEQASQDRVLALRAATQAAQQLYGALDELIQRAPEAQRKMVQANLADLFNERKDVFDGAINSVQNAQRLSAADLVSPDKQYAYFGGQLTPAQQLALDQNPSQRAAMKLLAEDIAQPASLTALIQTLQAIAKITAN